MMDPSARDPRVLPLPLRPEPLRVLDDAGIARVHEAALDVLDRVGVVARSAAIRADLAARGIRVDEAAQRVRFTRAEVEAALAAAPHAYTLAARDPRADLALDGEHGWLSTDGSAAEMLDLETGSRRATTLADLAAVSRVADAIPEIGFLWQSAEAGDVPVPVRPLHELRTQLTASGKHVQLMTAVNAFQAEGAIELARAVAGGADALRARPILSSFQVSLSPLTFEGGALEAAVAYGRAGVPAGFVAMPIACATAPATATGLVVLTHAELLAGLTILETLVPGAPTFYGACGTCMDLRTGLVTCGGPEDLLAQMAAAQLGHAMGLPVSIGTFATGAKASDWQAGLENGLSGFASLVSGADMCSGAGLLYAARTFSLEQMVLDAEAWSLLASVGSGLPVDDEDLAVEAIAAVGPAGDYLTEDHTIAHMRRLWQPRTFDRRTWEEWDAAGRPSAAERAREQVRAILASHVPLPLPDGTAAELDRIVGAFEARAGLG
jgi:trimethylamine--corrinoid protein Co-methyltransferase